MESFDTVIEKMEDATSSENALRVFLEELRKALIDNRLVPMGIDTIVGILQDQEDAIVETVFEEGEAPPVVKNYYKGKAKAEETEDDEDDSGWSRTTAVAAKKTSVTAVKKSTPLKKKK